MLTAVSEGFWRVPSSPASVGVSACVWDNITHGGFAYCVPGAVQVLSIHFLKIPLTIFWSRYCCLHVMDEEVESQRIENICLKPYS